MKGAIYLGEVEHRRFLPLAHEFRYPVCYYYLNVDEAHKIFRFPFIFSCNFPGILSFWRKNYFGDPKIDLKTSICEMIKDKTGERFNGQVYLFSNISYFGYCFNPVSFYFCFEESGELKFVAAEITNTPWGERHVELLKADGSKKIVHQFAKSFHVSPFMEMEIDYTWVFTQPAEKMTVLMQNRRTGEKKIIFDSTLEVHRLPLTAFNVMKAFFRFPLITFKTTLAIYWQALVLYLKKAPFYPHPIKEKRL